jgi:hypothetical protein
MHNRCLFSGIKLNVGRLWLYTSVVKKQYLFNFKLCNNLVTPSRYVKDMAVDAAYKNKELN